jgi:hypothetical protein
MQAGRARRGPVAERLSGDMALRVLHLCQFHFENQDIRVIGSQIDGGTSLSGIQDVVETGGGGYWQGDWSDGTFGGRSEERRAETLAWRAVNAGLGGSRRVVVPFCDRWHQPVLDRVSVPHSDGTPFSDGTEYESGVASSTVLAVVNGQTGGLNCTILDIAITSERALIGGERFTHVHPIWRERAYEISGIEDIPGGKRISFIPPIRGGIKAGDPLDFDDPRCVMRRVSEPTNALNMGVFASASITMVEDMRDPSL